MASFRNYYDILGIEASADSQTVKTAFRKLARQHHPDLNAGKSQSEEQFKLLNEAYEVLSNPEKRANYDLTMKAMGIAVSGVRQDTIAGKPSQGPATARSSNAQKASEKASEGKKGSSESQNDAKNGVSHSQPDLKNTSKKEKNSAKPSVAKPIQDLFESFLKKEFIPSNEQGIFRTNAAPNHTDSASDTVKPCRGEDIVVKTVITALEAQQGLVKTISIQHQQTCRRCSGTGKVSGLICTGCSGEKVLMRIKKMDVRIPAGVKQNSRVRVAKEGSYGSGGGENGDLFLQIDIMQEASLRIEGLDVYGEKQLSVTEAVLGGEIDVLTLQGNVKMTIPPGTQPGKIFRLKGRGVEQGKEKGDYLLTVSISIPEKLSEKEKALYQELARLHSGNRR